VYRLAFELDQERAAELPLAASARNSCAFGAADNALKAVALS
jgi:hypothetical protein